MGSLSERGGKSVVVGGRAVGKALHIADSRIRHGGGQTRTAAFLKGVHQIVVNELIVAMVADVVNRNRSQASDRLLELQVPLHIRGVFHVVDGVVVVGHITSSRRSCFVVFDSAARGEDALEGGV